jgi:RNA polymerase sigma factor (TIGR02999 family)
LPQQGSSSVTQLLLQWRTGDKAALEALVPLVYHDLRAVAHHYLQRERPGHTLQSAALVNEVYLRLVGGGPAPTENRAHFVAVAARLMRQILVDYARAHGAAKRGADCTIELSEAVELPQASRQDLVDLDDALKALTQRDEQQSQIVELRCFGGLTIEETAEVLKISPATVKRDWNMAKAWLSRQMRRSNSGRDGNVGQT